MRIKRTVLVDAPFHEVHVRGILIRFGKSLVNIIEDTGADTTVNFSDGSSDTAELVLG